MDTYCAFLELPPELRNIIYEYVAINEGGLHIKRRQKPKNGQHIAALSGLTLASSQIHSEYVAVVQEVSLWPDVKLRVSVRDFDFRHLRKFISTLRKREPFQPDENKIVRVNLAISACNNIDTERLANWLSLDDRIGLHFTYRVMECLSGHTYPAEPPSALDIAIVECSPQESSHARSIYYALEAWRTRCVCRVYRLRHTDPLKEDIFITWNMAQTYGTTVIMGDRYGQYYEVPSYRYRYGPLTDILIN